MRAASGDRGVDEQEEEGRVGQQVGQEAPGDLADERENSRHDERKRRRRGRSTLLLLSSASRLMAPASDDQAGQAPGQVVRVMPVVGLPQDAGEFLAGDGDDLLEDEVDGPVDALEQDQSTALGGP